MKDQRSQMDHREGRWKAFCEPGETPGECVCRIVRSTVRRFWAKLFSSSQPYELCVSGGGAKKIASYGPVLVACTCGIVTVTAAGDPRDYLLRTGDEQFFEHGDQVVACAAYERDAHVMVHPLG